MFMIKNSQGHFLECGVLNSTMQKNIENGVDKETVNDPQNFQKISSICSIIK